MLLTLPQRRGLDFCEQRFACVLVQDAPEKVLNYLEQGFHVIKYDEDIYGSVIEMPSEAVFVLMQLKGHSWTVLSRVDNQLPEVLYTENDIAKLSKISQTKVIFLRESDSEYGITLFFYDSGLLKRKIEFSHEWVRGREGEKVTGELMNTLLEIEPDFEMDYYFREVAPDLGIDRVEVFDDYNSITDNLLKENDAYAPCIVWPVLRKKCRAEISIWGLSKSDISSFKLIRLFA